MKKKIASAKKQIQELTDLLQRTRADFENFRKREEKKRQQFQQLANQDLILQLLPVLDNFDRSLKSTPQNSPLAQGVQLIKKQLADILVQNGLEKIDTKKGDSFNPQFHEAVAGKGDRITEVILDGYNLNCKVIRAARVRVKK